MSQAVDNQLAEFLHRLRDYFSFDPAMGRGYRIGNRILIPAGAGVTAGTRPIQLANHGWQDQLYRWKITMGTEADTVLPPDTGAHLRYTALAKMENDLIPRTISVGPGEAGVLYAPGRALDLLVSNPSPFDLWANFSLDEASSGLADWADRETFIAIAAAQDMNPPTFCDTFKVYSVTGGNPPLVQGFDDLGNLVYSEVLAVPRSAEIDRIPGIRYTIAPAGGVGTYVIYYNCLG